MKDEPKERLYSIMSLLITEIKNSDAKEGFDISKNNYHLLSKDGKYLLEFNDYFNRLNKLIDDLNIVIEFIEKLPSFVLDRKELIDPINYINYHLEVFYHKISTINDVLKMMTNSVFRLGIPEINCNWEKIKNKRKDISNSVFCVIWRYHKTFKPLINIRQLNTHRAINVNPTSNEIASLLLLKKNTDSDDKSELFIPIELIENEIEKHRNEILGNIRHYREIANNYVEEFINEISIEVVTHFAPKTIT